MRDDVHEITNEHGLPQTVQECDDGSTIPVCSQCSACVLPNKGQGTICDKCDHEFTLHCEHDLY